MLLNLSATLVPNVLTLWAHFNASVKSDLQEDLPSALVSLVLSLSSKGEGFSAFKGREGEVI